MVNIELLLSLTSLSINSLHCGSLLFVSAVSARTLNGFVEKKDDDLIKKFFPIWWPAGRDLMLPLGLVSVVCYGVTYYYTEDVSNLISGLSVFSVLLFTKFLMSENIDDLRNNKKPESTFDIAKSFTFRHHFRLLLSFFGVGYTIYSLVQE
eukprot:TRINITY_DN8594_c0_g1_i1.p1 TRINITY_DN8594_c0_g1~~TRINITY_DN8594_c0_g1_i1.p1  ORF type:complete len:151 (+),score=40.60 TRINITY_DN8594_c0_g1_i1:91-543(+)